MTCDMLKDISTLTTTPFFALSKMSDRCEDVICHSILESAHNEEIETKIDLGIGDLIIVCDGSDVRYKFLPSKSLEHKIVESFNSGKDPLIEVIESSLSTKLMKTYKELI